MRKEGPRKPAVEPSNFGKKSPIRGHKAKNKSDFWLKSGFFEKNRIFLPKATALIRGRRTSKTKGALDFGVRE
jgi:hypothetical protein